MAKTPNIRVATANDLSVIDRMLRALDGYHATLSPDVFRCYEGPARSPEWLMEAVEQIDRDILMANHDEGFVWVAEATPPNFPMFRPARWLSIDNLFVVPHRRRQGMGRHLMNAAYAWGRERDLSVARLNVWGNNTPASAFYASLGYRALKATLETEIPPGRDPH